MTNQSHNDLRERVARELLAILQADRLYPDGAWEQYDETTRALLLQNADRILSLLPTQGGSPGSGARYRRALENIRKKCFDDSEWGRYIDAVLREPPEEGSAPVPTAPAIGEDVEPSGTASLRGAARLEPEDLTAARMLAAQGWCHPSTAHKVMDGELADAIAHVFAPFIGLLREGFEHVVWCSGSADFGPGGQAREGWMKGPVKWLEKVNKAIPAARSDAPEAKPEGPSPSSPPSPASQGAVERAPEAPALEGEMPADAWNLISEALHYLESLHGGSLPEQVATTRLRIEQRLRKAHKILGRSAPAAPLLCPLCIIQGGQHQPTCPNRLYAKPIQSAPSAPAGLRDAKRVEEPGAYRDALETIVERVRMYKSPRPGDASVYVSQIELAQIAAASLATKAESSPPLPAGEGSSPKSSPEAPAAPPPANSRCGMHGPEYDHLCEQCNEVKPAAPPAGVGAPLQICLGCGDLHATTAIIPTGGGDFDEGCAKCGAEMDFLESMEEAIKELAKERNSYRDAYYDSEGKRVATPPAGPAVDLEGAIADAYRCGYSNGHSDAICEHVDGHKDMPGVEKHLEAYLETLPPAGSAVDLEALAELERIQWNGQLVGSNCPSCGGHERYGHTEKCKLAKLVARLRSPGGT